MPIFVRGHVRSGKQVTSYSRGTSPVTRVLRKEMKKGSKTGRLEKLFGKVNRQIDAAKGSMRSGYLKSGGRQLERLRSRRLLLINIDRNRYGLKALRR